MQWSFMIWFDTVYLIIARFHWMLKCSWSKKLKAKKPLQLNAYIYDVLQRKGRIHKLQWLIATCIQLTCLLCVVFVCLTLLFVIYCVFDFFICCCVFNFKGRWGYTRFFDVQQDVWLSYLLSLCHSRWFILLDFLFVVVVIWPMITITNDENWFSMHAGTRLNCFSMDDKFRKENENIFSTYEGEWIYCSWSLFAIFH